MAYEKVANLQEQLGLYGNYINSYTYNPQTPVYNSMMSLKYIVDNNEYNPPLSMSSMNMSAHPASSTHTETNTGSR